MAITVQSLITDALEELVAVPAGDTPGTADLAKGLAVLVRMVDASNANRGNIASMRYDAFTLQNGVAAYSIGIDPNGVLAPTLPTAAGTMTSAASTTVVWISGLVWTAALVGQYFLIAGVNYKVVTFTDSTHLIMAAAVPALTGAAYILNAPVRPVRIERANIVLSSTGSPVYLPLNLIDDKQQAAKGIRDVQSIPRDLYNEGGYPLSTYRFDPIPDQAYGLETWTWQQFAQSALSDVLVIPPGYYEYWMYALAMRLAAVFGVEPKVTTAELYAQASAEVMAQNAKSPRIRCDGDLPSSGGTFDWRTGIDSQWYK